MVNGVGIFDEDYCGDDDEYRAALFNFSDTPITVEAGERIVQLIIVPYTKARITEVQSLNSPSRGGFGTTGI